VEMYLYLLTANLVIDAKTVVEIVIHNPYIDGLRSQRIPVTGWKQPLKHVDIAVAAFPSPPSGLMAIAYQDFLKEPDYLFPGSLIYYIGIFEPWDRAMARSGRIGARDQSNLKLKGGYRYPAHLVDCRSYKGFSGSPCFVELPFAGLSPTPARPDAIPDDAGPVGDMHHVAQLCGMFTAHADDDEDGADDERAVSRYGIGVMLRVEEIKEALMAKDFQEQRRNGDAEYAASKESEGPQLENASVETPDEFSRFEGLTRNLIKVPKSEVDELRKKAD
jgi:hypothetical protein